MATVIHLVLTLIPTLRVSSNLWIIIGLKAFEIISHHRLGLLLPLLFEAQLALKP